MAAQFYAFLFLSLIVWLAVEVATAAEPTTLLLP
jgi:hypothetical protein